MFRSALRTLRFKPQDGLRVVARGRVSVYDPKGEYQIVCEHLEPEGLGALQLAFDQLKQRLSAEGLFDQRRKRPLPALPRKIGIVTSLDGAAVRDIIKVLRRRYPNAHIVIRPTRVQGDGAALDIARAMRAIGKVPGVDVVIVGRGGGSIEDLWAFNEEVVARAIAGCPVPTISAVGHETDVTIADFVADLRAPTPSAAAEMVVARKDDFCARIDRLTQRRRPTRDADALHRLESRLPDARSEAAGRGAAARSCAARGRALSVAAADARDVRPSRRLGGVRTRLAAADGRLAAGVDRADGTQPTRDCAAPPHDSRPQPARRARTRLCRVLERGPHRNHSRRVSRVTRRSRARHARARRAGLRCHGGSDRTRPTGED